MKVEITCPLGSECETAENNCIKRCAWYIKLRGNDPQTGKEIDQWKCTMAWLPILQIESNGISMATTASVESLRNETIERQDQALKVVMNATTPKHSQLR